MGDRELTEAIAGRMAWLLESLPDSQRTMAAKVGVSHTFIGKVGRGESLPSIQLVVGLAEAYGVSMDWYLRGLGPPFGAYGNQPAVEVNAPSGWDGLTPMQQARVQGFIDGLVVNTAERKLAQAG